MTQHDSFESALAIAFTRLAGEAPVAIDADALTSAIALRAPAKGADRRTFVGSRQLILVVVAALLVVAAAITIVGAARLLERRSVVFGEFTPAGELPRSPQGPRSVTAAVRLEDGRVLTIGPDASVGRAKTWSSMFDPVTGTWTEPEGAPPWRALATATALEDGRVLIAGGWVGLADDGLPTAGELYDPTTGSVEPTQGGLTTARFGHTATLLADGRVLIVGGTDSFGELAEMQSSEIFDPVRGSFTRTGSISVPRAGHSATRLADGRVLIAGGTTKRNVAATRTAEIFDPATGTFTAIGAMTTSRSMHAAVTLPDGRVLIVGGISTMDETGTHVPLASAELFDPARNAFSSTSSLVTERWSPTATVLADGRVLVAGGSNDYGSPRTAELFDPSTGLFNPAGTSTDPHPGAWSSQLPGDRVLLLDLTGGSTNGAAELWSSFDRPIEWPTRAAAPAPGFRPVRDANVVARSGHTATRLGDGRVLLTGGLDAARPAEGLLASAEILDPANGRSTAVGDMTNPRSGHVAVLLADGRVFVAGGEPDPCSFPDACLWPSPTAEVYDPTTRTFARLGDGIGPRPYRGSGSPAGVLLADGRVFYASMSFGTWGHRYTSVIDPTTGVVAPPQRIPCGSRMSLVRLVDDRVLVLCGGRRPYAYLFDPSGTAFSEVADVAGWDGAVGLADGRVLAVRTAGDAAVFDPSTGAFSPTGSMAAQDEPDPSGQLGQPYQRRLTLLADGRVLASGGRSIGDKVAASRTASELYDPATGAFRAIGPMSESRSRHSATLLDDGRVLIVGGVSRSPDRTDPEPVVVEVFDPSALPTTP